MIGIAPVIASWFAAACFLLFRVTLDVEAAGKPAWRSARPYLEAAAIAAFLIAGFELVGLMCAMDGIDTELVPNALRPGSTASAAAKVAAYLRPVCVALGAVLFLLAAYRWRDRFWLTIARHAATRCATCGYPKAGLDDTVCPECGNYLTDSTKNPSIARVFAMLPVLCFAAALVVLATPHVVALF